MLSVVAPTPIPPSHAFGGRGVTPRVDGRSAAQNAPGAGRYGRMRRMSTARRGCDWSAILNALGVVLGWTFVRVLALPFQPRLRDRD